MVPKETRAPPLNPPDPLLALQLGPELRTTGAGSVRTMETPLSPASVTVKLLVLPVGFDAFWAP